MRFAVLVCSGAGVFGAAGVRANAQTDTDAARALVAEMLTDAERRASLLQGGGTSGHDGGFFLASSDGEFSLRVAGLAQLRWVANFANAGANPSYLVSNPTNLPSDDFQHGFENARTRLFFSGDVSGDWFYRVEGDFGASGGALTLLNAFVGTTLENGATLTFGQFKMAFGREELVEARYQQAIDRTYSNEWLNLGRSQGVAYSGTQGDAFRYTISFTDGANQANTFFGDVTSDGSVLVDTDLAITARGEMLLEGDWDVLEDFTSAPGQARASMVGVGVHYQKGADEPRLLDDSNMTSVTVDYSVEGDGWNVFLSGTMRDSQHVNILTATTRAVDYGFTAQGGYYINDTTEVFARYDLLKVDDRRFRITPDGSGNDEMSTITLGVNKYLHGHAAKLTLDMNYAVDAAITTTGVGTTNFTYGAPQIGYLADDDEGQLYIRAQLQLLF